jgi:predicted nucleic acid-binding protein
VIVVDSSVVVAALTEPGPSRRLLAEPEAVHAPHLIDSEVANSIRRHMLGGRIPADAGLILVDRYRRMAVTRHASVGLLDRVWELRDSLTAYDATYVALAEAIDCPLVTGDARLSRAPGLRCTVTVIPG